MPRCGTQGLQPYSCDLTPTGLSPSTAGRSRPFQLQPRGSGRALQPHIPQRFPVRVQFRLFPFRSPLIWESLTWFLLLLLLGCFRSEGSSSHMGVLQVSPTAGSPIRVSPDRRLHASTRSLSQLATPFFSAQGQPSVRRRIIPSPLGTHTRFASIEVLCTAFTASTTLVVFALAFFTRKFCFCELHVCEARSSFFFCPPAFPCLFF